MRRSTPEDFWARCRRGAPEDCWPWTAARSKKGYGSVRYQGEVWVASRLAWFLTFGDIPNGLCVCHTCDNPSCVNPAHLFVGTVVENNRDRDRKGRTARGMRHGSVTCPEAVARGARNGLVKHPERRPYGRRNGRYTCPERTRRGEDHSGAKLTSGDVVRIKQLAAAGLSQRAIGSEFGVTHGTVGAILRGESWRTIA